MRIVLGLFLTLSLTASRAQEYSIVQTMPNASGQPGDMLMPMIHVQNSSNEGILMHLERIVLNLPNNWTSCFCYPHCVAPWIDTMSFMIPAYSVDSVTPNFCTDSFVPGTGTVQIILYQGGFENAADTITFTGTTTANSVFDIESHYITVFPNPFAETVTILNDDPDNFRVIVSDLQGRIVFAPAIVYRESATLDLSFLSNGMYFIQVFSGEHTCRQSIIKG